MYRLTPDPAPLDDADLAALYALDRARPSLRVNAVTSADGAATVEGRSAGLSSPADKRVLRLLRAHCDALLVGAGTLRDERYRPLRLDEERRRWRHEHGLAEYPPLVVVSRSLALDPALACLAEAPVRPIVVTAEAAPAAARAALSPVAEVLVCGDGGAGDGVDVAAALAALRERGLARVLCEGGPRLFGALTAADLVDEVCLTVAPLLAGPGAGRIIAGGAGRIARGVPVPRPLALRHAVATDDGTVLLRYAR